MNTRSIETRFSEGDFDSDYADFIMGHAGPELTICNGDTLTAAMESGYLADEFLSYIESMECM